MRYEGASPSDSQPFWRRAPSFSPPAATTTTMRRRTSRRPPLQRQLQRQRRPHPRRAQRQGETIRLWLNGGDTPDALVDYAIAEFNKIHPDVTVKFERQEWTGIVEKLHDVAVEQRQP